MHFDDLVFIYLAKSKERVTWEHILYFIREGTNYTDYKNQQILFLERQDLNNIASDFNIIYATRKHTNNFANVKLRVQCKGKDNVVKYSPNLLR